LRAAPGRRQIDREFHLAPSAWDLFLGSLLGSREHHPPLRQAKMNNARRTGVPTPNLH